MGLPFVPVKERLSPDDVKSAQHMQKLVDTANDAEDLLVKQHQGGTGVLAGEHLGAAPPVLVGVVCVAPPVDDASPPEVKYAAGYVDRNSMRWRKTEKDTNGYQHHVFEFAAAGRDYAIWSAEVGVAFSGTPSINADGANNSNMLCIHPIVHVVSGMLNASAEASGYKPWTSTVEVSFGRDHDGVNFWKKIVQFTVLCHGFPRPPGK